MNFNFKKAVFLLWIVNAFLHPTKAHAQCGAGYTNVATNWDWQYFDTLPASNFRFTLGKTSMDYKWTGTTNTFQGTTTQNNHTAESGSYGIGNDLKFMKSHNVTDTLVFQDSITNLQFSIYDLDNSQGLNVTATNGAGVAQNITMTKVSGTIITITGSGTTSATATTTNTNAANNATTGTVNISIPTGVTKVILKYTKTTLGSTADTIFVSDISACAFNSLNSWSVNYQTASTPEAGQPTYTLGVYNNNIYVIDITNKTASILYTDASLTSINSLAYDPIRQIIYYTSNVRTITNKSVYKYDIKTNTKSTWISDITTYGVQLRTVTGSGLGSAGACYYDEALYLATDGNITVGDAATIWRIDVNPSTGNPVRASRLMSRNALPNISTRLFDWSDFVIKNGVVYCFNQSSPSPTKLGAYHFGLNAQDTLRGYTTGIRVQAAMDYANNIYHLGNYGLLERYNEDGTFTSLGSYTRAFTADSLVTDGSESFKYPYDFGKDSANYGVAFNKYNPAGNLKLGSIINYGPTNTLDNSTSDNDGVSSFPELRTSNASYSVDVAVTNTTGATAYLYAYLDFNGDGDFNDPGETSVQVAIPNGATSATVTWTGLVANGFVGSSEIRFRLAPTPGEAGSPAGYASNGETEDYGITIGASTLPVELIKFSGTKLADNTVQLDWSTASESGNAYFEIQRSSDFKNFEAIGQVDGNGNSRIMRTYTFIDKDPQPGNNYYRLNQVDYDSKSKLTNVINIKIEENQNEIQKEIQLTVYPNPSKGAATLNFNQENGAATYDYSIYSLSGQVMYQEQIAVEEGQHALQIDAQNYPAGPYIVMLFNRSTGSRYEQKFIRQ